MAWLRSAMHRAAEVRGRSSFRAAVRSYAGNVVNHAGNAVSRSSKKSQDRAATKEIKSYKEAVRSLEEVSVSSKGEERVQLLRRWLVSLRAIEKLDVDSVENGEKSSERRRTKSDKNDSPGKANVVLYYDPDLGVSPVNFLDVFLHSQALEGMTMSMILGAPNEEEILLLSELFGLCLTGGKEVHDAIVKKIQDLAKAFSIYDDEVLAKRGELLQFAQGAISGLKVNADILRIDSEVSQIHQSLKQLEHKKLAIEVNENSSEPADDAALEVIKESVAPIQLCCRLESLLLKKRLLNNGDTPETHAHKVDKLKILSESVLSSASKTEKRVSDHRQQKEEALHFRVSKTSEVSQIEKDLGAEVSVLEKQRDELEAELKKVKSSLAVATARLQNAREEREQFDDASNQLLVHFKAKEDELSKAIASYRAEADTCSVFVNFLEAAWAFQSSYVEQKDKKVNDELENHEEYYVNVARSLLSTYKDALGPAMTNLKKDMKNLKRYDKAIDPDEEFLQDIERRKGLEKAYLAAEAKVTTIFDAVESVKEQFYSTIDHVSRKGVEPVTELCDAIANIKRDFDSLARPTLRSDTPTQGEQTPAKESPQKGASPSSKRALAVDLKSIFAQKLVTRTPQKKPYIPLGGSSENSPSSNPKNDSKPSEQDKAQVGEGEKSSQPVDKPSELTLQIRSTQEVGGNTDAKKTNEGELLQPFAGVEEKSSGIEKKSPDLNIEVEKQTREQLTVQHGGIMDSAESQESNMSQPSMSDDEKLSEPTKELRSSPSEKEVAKPETKEYERGKTSQLSTSDSEKLALKVPEVGGNTKTAEIEHEQGKTSESSTSESEDSSDTDEEPPKPNSQFEEDEHSPK